LERADWWTEEPLSVTITIHVVDACASNLFAGPEGFCVCPTTVPHWDGENCVAAPIPCEGGQLDSDSVC
jgi:hypothetical protein